MSAGDDLIYGKNAVLAYLQRADDGMGNDYKLLHQALIKERCDQDAALPDIPGEVERVLKKLRNETGNKGLKLPNIKQLEGLPSVKVNKILLATGSAHDGRVDKIKSLARQQKIPLQSCDRRKLDQLAGPQRRHQGVVALISPTEMWTLDTFLQKLVLDRINRELSGKSMSGYTVVALDGIEDPHNLGAIVRTAESAGARAVFVPQRRSAGLTGTVAKTSAGAVATLPMVRVSNLVHSIETMKKYGFWVVALDHEAQKPYWEADLSRPLLIIIGNEGKGVARLVKEKCDFLLRIPMLGQTESLNASVAAGIVLYEVVRQCKADL
jgi:23S rRNA (guanosine2251-2'-O)-methyltransferase